MYYFYPSKYVNPLPAAYLRWELIKENKKVRKQEKQELDQEKKKTRTRPRKQ